MQGIGDDNANARVTPHRVSWQRLRVDLLTPRAIVTGAVVIAAFMVSLCGVVVYQSRDDALQRAHETARNLALIAERDIERNFELYSLSLQAVIDGLNDREIMTASPHVRQQALFDRSATASYLGSILVLDETGRVRLDSLSADPPPMNFGDRRYFTVQRDRPDAGLFVSDPYHSRLRAGPPTARPAMAAKSSSSCCPTRRRKAPPPSPNKSAWRSASSISNMRPASSVT